MRSIRHAKRARPFISNDFAAADREARRRYAAEHVDCFLGVRPRDDAHPRTEFIVAPIDDLARLHAQGGWLLHLCYTGAMSVAELGAACVHSQRHDAVIDATMRMAQGAAPVFMARRAGEFLVAPLLKWPQFARVEWTWMDSFGA